jgi:hypothetical protein
MTHDLELERFKRLNLADLAVLMGFVLDKKESSRSSLIMRHDDGEKLIISTDTDSHFIWFSVRSNASGSVIDFVQFRQGGNLGQVRKFLRAYCSNSSFPTAPKNKSIPKPQKISHDRAALLKKWHSYKPCTSNPAYLVSRGLHLSTIEAFSDCVRSDDRRNTVFKHVDLEGLSGWELKNRDFTGFAKGGQKALFACKIQPKNEPRLIVITESAIDAMSYYQIHQASGLYLSFGGEMSPAQIELLSHILNKYPAGKVISATDNDKTGEEFAIRIQTIRPDAIRARPMGKDWNVDVQTCQISPRIDP